MSEKQLFWVTMALSFLALVLFVGNSTLISKGQAKQQEIAERQAQINTGLRVGQINEAMVRALANMAVAQKDEKIRALLSDNGITIQTDAAKNR